jgi:starch synthase
MYAMRYGCIPVVHAVGGLRDTVSDGRTGFQYAPNDPGSLVSALERAVEAFHKPRTWRTLMRAAMAQRNGWERGADEYVRLYEEAARGET